MTTTFTIDLSADTSVLTLQRKQLMLQLRDVQSEKRGVVEAQRNYFAQNGRLGRKRTGFMGLFNNTKRAVNNNRVQELDKNRDVLQNAINAIDLELLARKSE